MRKIIISLLFVLSASSLFSQETSVMPIIAQNGTYIELIEKKYNQQVVHMELDVLKDTREVYRQMFADVQYGFILLGDENFSHISLKISGLQGENWTVLVDEKGVDGIASVFYKFNATETYRFEITATLKPNKKYGYYSLMMFR